MLFWRVFILGFKLRRLSKHGAHCVFLLCVICYSVSLILYSCCNIIIVSDKKGTRACV